MPLNNYTFYNYYNFSVNYNIFEMTSYYENGIYYI